MTENEEIELISLTRDNNEILRNIWDFLTNPKEDIKDFNMNVIANLIANKIEKK